MLARGWFSSKTPWSKHAIALVVTVTGRGPHPSFLILSPSSLDTKHVGFLKPQKLPIRGKEYAIRRAVYYVYAGSPRLIEEWSPILDDENSLPSENPFLNGLWTSRVYILVHVCISWMRCLNSKADYFFWSSSNHLEQSPYPWKTNMLMEHHFFLRRYWDTSSNGCISIVMFVSRGVIGLLFS